MSQPRDNVRDANCVALYAGGATLQEIGDVFGVSRERIRQIVRRNGVPIRSRVSTLDPLRVVAEARRSSSVAECARRVGCCHPTVTRLLDELGLRDVFLRRRRWTEASAVAALQGLARKVGRTPRQQDTVDADVPSHETVRQLFGSWRAGLVATGLPLAKWNRRAEATAP